MLRLEGRAIDRLHVIGSYVYSESKGVHEGEERTGASDIHPAHFVNQRGYLSDHSRRRVKLNGFVCPALVVRSARGRYWT